MQAHGDALARRMFGFPAEAARCATMQQLTALTAEVVSLAGMTVVASGMITGPSASGPDVFHFHNWPAEWLELYRQRGFLERDPLPRWALVSGLPARWTRIVADLPPNDPGHEILALVGTIGLREGLVVPVRTAAGHLGLVSVGGRAETLGDEECHFLQVVGTASLHRAEALRMQTLPRPPVHLSRREQQCVSMLTHGATEREIAERLGISEVTVRFHIDNARGKIGARSRTHLAGIAGQWLSRPTEP